MNYLLTNPDNIFYLCGYKPTSHDERECYLLVESDIDLRLVETVVGQMKTGGLSKEKLMQNSTLTIFTSGMMVEQIRGQMTAGVSLKELMRDFGLGDSLLEKIGNAELYVEMDDLTIAEYDRLSLKLNLCKSQLDQSLLRLRSIKTVAEIKLTKEAVRISEIAFEKWLKVLDLGKVTEISAKLQLEQMLIAEGATAIAFPPIVAANENSALPHHASGQQIIKESDVLLVDWGATFHGYHADMTRTFILPGKNNSSHKEFDSHLALVKEVYEQSISDLEDGLTINQINENVQKNLKEFSPNMIHSLGHGIGISVHELPSFSGTGDLGAKFKSGQLITIEPGIYFPGKYGIRLERTVLVTDTGVEELGELPLII